MSRKNITFYVAADYDAMSVTAADLLENVIKSNPFAAIGFATGSSPVGMYKELIRRHKECGLDLSGITGFNLDEYYPIKKSNEQSYCYFMNNMLFDHVNVNKHNMHIPNGEAEDVAEECRSYDKMLEDTGGLDFQILGVGLNGHIGFNEPADELTSGTHLAALDEKTISANARFFNNAGEVPRNALTMGIGSIMAAKCILLIASGEAKADIIRKSFTGPITTVVPASLLQLHHNVHVVLTKDAACKMEHY